MLPRLGRNVYYKSRILVRRTETNPIATNVPNTDSRFLYVQTFRIITTNSNLAKATPQLSQVNDK